MRELVLVGAGRVGRAFLRFWNDRDILVVDPNILMETCHPNLVVDSIKPGMAKTAIVATPGSVAPRLIIKCFEAGMNVVDVSFHDADFEDLGKIAEEHGCWYIPDAGFGPGIMNMMCSRLAFANYPKVESISAYIGGVPKERKRPWDYVSTWNTEDHLSEYTRPARYIENGHTKSVMPLESDVRILNVPGLGTMEAFCSDGLRTLLDNPGVNNMAEFTLRWPGFIDKMRLMYQSGMLRPGQIKAFAQGISESGAWEFKEKDIDISVLIVEAKMKDGTTRGQRMIHTRGTRAADSLFSSMSWCTAVGTGAALNMALEAQDPGDPTYVTSLKPGLHTIEEMVQSSRNWAAYDKMLHQGGLEIVETMEIP